MIWLSPWRADSGMPSLNRRGDKQGPVQSRSVRQQSERRGRRAEWLAALALMVKGYRVLARRYKGPAGGAAGEIDLIVARGRRLVFVEVKQRQSELDAEMAISNQQAQRIARSAASWIDRHPGYGAFEVGFDAVHVVPWRLPRHVKDAFRT